MRIENCERLSKDKKKSNTLKVVINNVVCCVPEDINNSDYKYIKQLEDEGKLVVSEKDMDDEQ